MAVVNSAAMNTGVYISELEFSSFPDICPGVGLLDHMATLFLVFLGSLHSVFIIMTANFIFYISFSYLILFLFCLLV